MQSKPASEFVTPLIIDAARQEVINKIARKYTKNSSISWEDAAQNAMMKVYAALKAGKFRHEGVEKFQHWATVVALYEIQNFVKKESLRTHQSLDAVITGTDIPLVETISDKFKLLDAVERADLIVQAKQAIINLDWRYPRRSYLKIWQGVLQEKKFTQIGYELGISQGEVSKRWKELIERVSQELGLLQPEVVKREQQNTQGKYTRRRSKDKW